MIHIMGDLYIDSDELQYILKQDMHRKEKRKKKDGTYEEADAFKVISYHSNISGLLTSVMRWKHMEFAHKADSELRDAIEFLRDFDLEFLNLMKKQIPESEWPIKER